MAGECHQIVICDGTRHAIFIAVTRSVCNPGQSLHPGMRLVTNFQPEPLVLKPEFHITVYLTTLQLTAKVNASRLPQSGIRIWENQKLIKG